jgi:hypothetical protein
VGMLGYQLHERMTAAGLCAAVVLQPVSTSAVGRQQRSLLGHRLGVSEHVSLYRHHTKQQQLLPQHPGCWPRRY